MANFHMVNALSMNIKDSRWLQLEVCREYQRNKCSRSDTECKFAHPLPHVEVQNGKVTACFDSIKGRCNREKPPCKYFHPPQHLKEQLLINGRNNLAIKNALMQQFAAGSLPMAGTVPMTSPTAPMYSLPPSMSQFYTAAPTQAVGDAGLVAPLALPQLQQKMQRSDRLEVEQPLTAAALDGSRKRPRDAADELGEPAYDAQVYFGAFPGMGVAYKRSAGDKAGIPCYPAPGAASYQQLMLQQQQQSYLHQTPCEYTADHERPASGHSAASAGGSSAHGTATNGLSAAAGAASPPPQSAASASDSGASGADAGSAGPQPVTVSAGLSTALTTSTALSAGSLPPVINPALYTGYAISKAALPAAGVRPVGYPVAAAGLTAGAGAPVALSADQLLLQQQQQQQQQYQLQVALQQQQQQQTQQRLLMQQRLLLQQQQQQQQQYAANPYLQPAAALYAAQPAAAAAAAVAYSSSSPYLAMGSTASASPYFAMAGYGQPSVLASQQQMLAGAAPAQTGLAAANAAAAAAYAQIQNGEPALKRMRKM